MTAGGQVEMGDGLVRMPPASGPQLRTPRIMGGLWVVIVAIVVVSASGVL